MLAQLVHSLIKILHVLLRFGQISVLNALVGVHGFCNNGLLYEIWHLVVIVSPCIEVDAALSL